MNCDKDVRGFPTIRVLNNGKKEKDYTGPRDEHSLNAFLASVFNENIRKKPIKVLKRNLKRIRNKRKKRTVYSSLLRKKAKKAATKRKAKKDVKKKATKRKAKKDVKKKATKRKTKK